MGDLDAGVLRVSKIQGIMLCARSRREQSARCNLCKWRERNNRLVDCERKVHRLRSDERF